MKEQNCTWCFPRCHWRGAEPGAANERRQICGYESCSPSLSELWIRYICSAVSADASCLRPRSRVKLSAFVVHQESRSALTWDTLFWVSKLIWPGIKHVWHPGLCSLPLKLLRGASRARDISADILNKASVNSGYLGQKWVFLERKKCKLLLLLYYQYYNEETITAGSNIFFFW